MFYCKSLCACMWHWLLCVGFAFVTRITEMMSGDKILRHFSRHQEKLESYHQQNYTGTTWRDGLVLLHLREANGLVETKCESAVWSSIRISVPQIHSLNKYLLGAFWCQACAASMWWFFARDMDFSEATNDTCSLRLELPTKAQNHFLAAFLLFPIKCHHLGIIWLSIPHQKLHDIILHNL